MLPNFRSLWEVFGVGGWPFNGGFSGGVLTETSDVPQTSEVYGRYLGWENLC